MKISNDCFLYTITYYQSSIPKEIITSYNNIILQDLIKRNNKSLQSSLEELFYYITKFPFYLITKILNAVKSKLSKGQALTINNIMHFISDLFCSNQIPHRLSLLFDIFDIDSNGVIDFDDISFLLQNMYIILYNSGQGLTLLKDIVYSSSQRKTITKEIFINQILHENGDIFYLFFLLCNKENIYSKDYLHIFIKHNYNECKYVDVKDSVVAPSKKLQKFAEKYLEVKNLLDNECNSNKNDDGNTIIIIGDDSHSKSNSGDDNDDFEKELSVLDDFEENYKNCFSEYIYKNSKYKKGVSASSMVVHKLKNKNNFRLCDESSPLCSNNESQNITQDNINTNNNTTNNTSQSNNNYNIGSSSLGLVHIRMSCNTIQQLKKNNLIINNEETKNEYETKPSSAKFDIDKGYAELKLRKLYRGILEKAKIIIHNKMIFVLCKNKSNKDSQINQYKKIVSLYYLNNYYISYEGILNEKIQNNKTYHKLTFRSNINQHLRTVTFFSSKFSKLNSFINLITKTTNYRDIREHYTFTSKINHGAFGTLYLSQNITLNQVTAVKQISKSIPHNSAIWEKEIFHILHANPFENIILCLDLFESLSNIYFVYEYLPYGTLRDFMKDTTKEKHPLYKENFIIQLSTAINHINTFGIIHRDIKPDNLMITFHKGMYAVKVIDFGLGKIIGPQEKTNESYGSLAYSAPEVVLAEDYGFEPDVWSIGMVVYYLVFKIDPYSDLNLERENIHDMLLKNNVYNVLMNRKKADEDFLVSIIKDCLCRGKTVKVTSIINKFFEKFNLQQQ